MEAETRSFGAHDEISSIGCSFRLLAAMSPSPIRRDVLPLSPYLRGGGMPGRVFLFFANRTKSILASARTPHGVPARTGLGSALSEVKACFPSPDWLAGVPREMGPSLTAERAIRAWAVRRGDLWR
jgi:hypothetical protein